MINPVAIRLLNQQLIVPQFSYPAEVVSHMGAMQAQEYRAMRWAVGMRTKKPSHKAFKEAFDSGQIIRLHLMRGTWQLVTAEDYWPFLTLCAPKAIAVTKGWMSSNKISIPDDELYRVRDILAQTASDKGSATKEDFVNALAARGLRMDDHRLSYHIRMAEFSGTLCSGDLLPFKATYALTANKVKTKSTIDESAFGSKDADYSDAGKRQFLPDSMRDQALMRFTRKYFQSHQPATLEDFVWWSGLNVNDCRKGIALLGDTIHKETWKGREFYLTDNCRTRGFRTGKLLLIPPYDEYLIGYKGEAQKPTSVSSDAGKRQLLFLTGRGTTRDIVLPPEHRHRAHNNSGIFQPIIARDGIICGNWSPFREDCQVEFFDDSNDMLGADASQRRVGLQEAWALYQRFRQK